MRSLRLGNIFPGCRRIRYTQEKCSRVTGTNREHMRTACSTFHGTGAGKPRAAASDLISDSSMFSEIDCEIDSDFHFHFSLSLAHRYPLMVSNLNVKRCMIDLDDWI